MFYENQTKHEQDDYKRMLTIIGNLTLLFSESDCPYLPYRAHENIFCKYFSAENLGRKDCSADARKEKVGIGLKTWMGNDDQKVAEFGKLRDTFKDLSGIELVRKISEYRNERIRVTMARYGLDKMIYHIIKRVPGKMLILEHPFDYIDLKNIKIIEDRGNINNTYFSDGNHIYHFSTSKNTLYMIFSDLELADSFEVEIMEDPYQYLMELQTLYIQANKPVNQYILNLTQRSRTKEQLCLRLYSTKRDGTKFVAEKSGLNQWNASGRKRHPNELYIPYPAEDRRESVGFFPDRDTIFELILSDGTVVPAKVCQADGKAIMSNPNKVLGKWLLRKVFGLPEKTLISYEMLECFGVDSVIFTKEGELKYSLDFADIGTYEELKEGGKIT